MQHSLSYLWTSMMNLVLLLLPSTFDLEEADASCKSAGHQRTCLPLAGGCMEHRQNTHDAALGAMKSLVR